MGRNKRYDDGQVIQWIDDYWKDRMETKNPERATFKALSEYLQKEKGAIISDNLLRHTPAVASHFQEMKYKKACAGDEGSQDSPDMKDRCAKLESLLKAYLIPQLFNHVLKVHEGFDVPEDSLNPGIAEKAVIGPKTNVFDHEMATVLKDYFERTEK